MTTDPLTLRGAIADHIDRSLAGEPDAAPSIVVRMDKALWRVVQAALREGPALPFRPTHRHLKTGSLYQTLDVVTNATNAQNGERMMLYRDNLGRTFARARTEFDDGRFDRIARAKPDGEPHA